MFPNHNIVRSVMRPWVKKGNINGGKLFMYNNKYFFVVGIFLICLLLIAPTSATITKTETTDGEYTVISWTTNLAAGGGQDSTNWTAPYGVTNVEYIVIAGGGSGGANSAVNNAGGGGGAGGFRNGTGLSVTAGTNYTVTIGAGGAAVSGQTHGNKGSNSSFSTIEATGGGYGASEATAGNGGSGGGGSGLHFTGAGIGNEGSYTPVEGYNGGNGYTSPYYAAGGGGGASMVGFNVTDANGGNGGDGKASSITGSSVTYAGGGGGGHYGAVAGNPGAGGAGGGGSGSKGATTATSGTAYTGGGGGGAGNGGTSGAGGSGIVIIRYYQPKAPVASFVSTNISVATNSTLTGWEGYAPFTMKFTNTSTGSESNSWVWNYTRLGDSGPVTFNSSAYYNPTYTFTNTGNYSISLNVTNSHGTNISTQTTWVNVSTLINADFTASNLSGSIPLYVQFNDTTIGSMVDTWEWTFGDYESGNTSTIQNPSYIYNNNGTYTVNLTVINGTTISTKLRNITVYNTIPIADFTASNWSGSPPLYVQFTDTSTGINITSWYWDFGDGNTSSLQNPEHTFENIGEYQVNLTVTNDGGSSTKLQNITVAYFGAHFIANKTSGAIPFPVSFTDTSIGNYDTWNWSVDDGTLHWFNESVYADRNLEYTFNDVGSWRVNLSVQNISESAPIYSTSMNITATNVPPVASFTGYPSAGTTSTTFIFNSTSTGIITTYNWSFGDGNYSATQNTTHVFPSNGIYNVNLTVSNDGGSSYIVHPFTVSAFSVSTSISPTSGVIPLLATFNETYSGLIPDSYYWEFGDGATSTDKNTTHTYTTIGTFNVNHRIMNGSIISWANTTSAVTALGGSVTANFTANVTEGDYPLDVQFTDTSTYTNATPSSWYWTFGDGLTSTSQNPSHTYSNAGVYSVTFTVNTDYGSSSMNKTDYIHVGGVAANGRQDIILTNTNNIVTLYIKDSNSGNLITHAAVSDEMGNELTSYGNGIFSGSYSTGQHTFTANATDYYTNRATYLISGDLIQTIYLTQVATSVSTTWYTPKTIVISFVDAYGNQVRGASVNARFNETTLPNGVSDLISNYGMNVNIANEALNGTLLMSGSTDYQGSIVFTMLSALKYDIAITYNGETNYYSIYPQDSQYQFRFLTTVATDNIWDDLYANGNTKVWATEPDVGNVTFWWSFQDMTSLTTEIDYFLKDVDLNTIVYTETVLSPVAGNIYQVNYTVPNVRGKNYIAYVNYTRDV